jgi:phosphotransferase system HPr-like phosphotransfer protein
MQRCRFQVNCKLMLHFRPLAIIAGVARSLEPCRVFIVHERQQSSTRDRQRFSTSQINALLLREIQNQEVIELQTRGGNELVALHVMKEVFDSLPDLPLDVPVSRFNSPGVLEVYERLYRDGARSLHERIEAILTDAAIEDRHNVLVAIAKVLNLSDGYKVSARFSYAHGMHVLPCQILAGLRTYFPDTEAELLYRRDDGELNSVDVFNVMGLCATGITDSQVVTVKAAGRNAERVARTIRNIIEHMQNIVERRTALHEAGRLSKTSEREILNLYLEEDLPEPETITSGGSLSDKSPSPLHAGPLESEENSGTAPSRLGKPGKTARPSVVSLRSKRVAKRKKASDKSSENSGLAASHLRKRGKAAGPSVVSPPSKRMAKRRKAS